MKDENLQRLLALGLNSEALSVVYEIIRDERAPADHRRKIDREWKAKDRARKKIEKSSTVAPAVPGNGHQISRTVIHPGTEPWRAWEKFKGKPFPVGRSGTWEVESEWPPGYTPEGTIQ